MNFLRKILSKICGKSDVYAAVGDYCSSKLIESKTYPRIIVYDGKTKQHQDFKFEVPSFYKIMNISFRGGVFDKGLVKQIEDAVHSASQGHYIALCVQGEENELIFGILSKAVYGSATLRPNFIYPERH